MKVTLKIKPLPHYLGLSLPAYQSANASGLDLLAAVDEEGLLLRKGSHTLIPTGLTLEIPPAYEGQIRPRSGLANKYGIGILNSPGTIDADYRGEVKIILINHGHEDFLVTRGMRIAQLVIAPVAQVNLSFLSSTENLTPSDRGSGGFGHTGV